MCEAKPANSLVVVVAIVPIFLLLVGGAFPEILVIPVGVVLLSANWSLASVGKMPSLEGEISVGSFCYGHEFLTIGARTTRREVFSTQHS